MYQVRIKTKTELKNTFKNMLQNNNIRILSNMELEKIVDNHLDRNRFVKNNLGKEITVYHIFKGGDAALNKSGQGLCLEQYEYDIV